MSWCVKDLTVAVWISWLGLGLLNVLWAQQTEPDMATEWGFSPFTPVSCWPWEASSRPHLAEMPQLQHAEWDPLASGDPHPPHPPIADWALWLCAGTVEDSLMCCADCTAFLTGEWQEAVDRDELLSYNTFYFGGKRYHFSSKQFPDKVNKAHIIMHALLIVKWAPDARHNCFNGICN